MTELFSWIASFPALVQIPLVIGLFLAVIAALVVAIEIAPRHGRRAGGIRFAACLVVPAGLGLLWGSVWWAAIIAAALGAVLFVVDRRARGGSGHLLQLIGFLAPAVVLLLVGLVYPSISTVIAAFLDNRGARFVGIDNFVWIFTQPAGVTAVLNTMVWVLVVPLFSTGVGLAYAAVIDRSRGEKVFKALVFLPMAISFVGASIIWRLVYDAKPADQSQIGLLNQIVVLLGGDPVAWLHNAPWNNLFLMAVLVWVETGFSMVVLSAAIKGVPAEQLEAAALDGTNSWQRFRHVTIPGIRGPLLVVVTTISIASLKVFDIVRTMTAGANGTSVLANEMFTQWKGFEVGRSAAYAIVLLVLVIPLIVYNARQLGVTGTSR